MSLFLFFLISVFLNSQAFSAPVLRDSKDIVLVPANRFVPMYPYNNPYPIKGQVRQNPLDLIGNWIQSSSWFPIEINVPDTISGFGMNVQNFAQNAGTGFNTFTQNVGSGWNNFAQNFGNGVRNITQGIPLINGFNKPNKPNKYFILMPVPNNNVNMETVTDKVPINPFEDDANVFLEFP